MSRRAARSALRAGWGQHSAARNAGAGTVRRSASSSATKMVKTSSLIVDKLGKTYTSNEREGNQKLILDSIHARDVSLLEHVADKFTGVPATMVRREKFSILRTNRFSAVIGQECMHLFEKDSASSRAVAQKVSTATSTMKEEYSFPQLAAEACLNEASTQLELKLCRLGMLVDAVTKPLKNTAESNGERADFEMSVGQFQRLLPLKQALDEIDTDIREHHQMLDEALRNEFSFDLERQSGGRDGDGETINSPSSSLDASSHKDKNMNNVLQLLTSHAGRSRAMGGRVLELKNALQATREVWELQLDVDRNRVVRLNLRATILGMSCAAASLPAAAMGMNVPHGLEDSAIGLTGAFSAISFAMGAIGVGLWGAFTRQSRSTFIPSLFGGGKHEKNVRELRALRYVLVNLDNLDDVLRDDITKQKQLVNHPITDRERVRKEIQSVGSGEAADAESVDLVFEVFDKNQDGKICPREWESEAK